MSITIVWSLTNGGSAITSDIDHGDLSNGDTGTAKEIYIRHNGSSSITACGIFIREYTGTYTGSSTASNDISEILSWGDAVSSTTFGGFMINMDKANSYPTATWPTVSSKSPTNGCVFRTGYGDSELNKITITTATGATASGTIQSGSSPNVAFSCRIVIPTAEDTVGIREWETILVYNFTS